MEEKYISAQEFANAIGIKVQTVREWDKQGKLKAHHKTPGKHRFYSTKQVDEYLGGKYNNYKYDYDYNKRTSNNYEGGKKDGQ